MEWEMVYSDLTALHNEETDRTGYVELFFRDWSHGYFHWEVVNGDATTLTSGRSTSPDAARKAVEKILDWNQK